MAKAVEQCRKCGKESTGPFHTCDRTLYTNGVEDAIAAVAQMPRYRISPPTVDNVINAIREKTGVKK